MIGVGKAIGLRVKLGRAVSSRMPQRVKICGQMAANTVGANDHQRPDAIKDGALDCAVRDFDALFFGFGSDLFAQPVCFLQAGAGH